MKIFEFRLKFQWNLFWHIYGSLGLNELTKILVACMQFPLAQDTLQHCDIIIRVIAPQITSLMIVCSTVYSGADQRKHKSCGSLTPVWGIHWWPVNSPHKWPVTWKMFPFDEVSIWWSWSCNWAIALWNCDGLICRHIIIVALMKDTP